MKILTFLQLYNACSLKYKCTRCPLKKIVSFVSHNSFILNLNEIKAEFLFSVSEHDGINRSLARIEEPKVPLRQLQASGTMHPGLKGVF